MVRAPQRLVRVQALLAEQAAAVRTWEAAHPGQGLDAVTAAAVPDDLDGARDHLVRVVVACRRAGVPVSRPVLAETVRALADRLADQHPGRSIEVRVPPFAAVQIGDGTPAPTHTRGTPPSVVETNADTFIGLVSGDVSWTDARADGRVTASGSHSDLSGMLPLR